ncbi:Nup133 N terminal like-domain-containing protein [Gongronella butleri]|nr:Nup133 N terminal like-domain-containing protein [Gongronella butleri]
MIATEVPQNAIPAITAAAATLNRTLALDDAYPDIAQALKNGTNDPYVFLQENNVQPMVVKNIFTMPVAALDKIRQRANNEPAGLLTDIHRAYFVVKNQLYLWNYNERQQHAVYEDTHPIVAVGVCKAKSDVFSKEVSHVLIVATTNAVSVIALQYKCDPSLNDSLTFYKTDIMTTTGGVSMKRIIGTPTGRVLMLGNDGNIWELHYKRDEGWFTKGCYTKLMSNKAVIGFGKKHHYTDMALSAQGDVLYQLTAESAVGVVHLGQDGTEYREVGIDTQTCHNASLLSPNSPLLMPNTFKILSIHATTPEEAKAYQCVAVTTLGCRLYFSHFSGAAQKVPNGITMINVRNPPHQLAQLAFPAAAIPPTMPQTIEKCFYSHAVSLLVCNHDNKQAIVSLSPDVAQLALHQGRTGLVEMGNANGMPDPVLAMEEVHTPQALAPVCLNELIVPVSSPSRHFLVLTASGLTLLVKQRPIDMLHNLIVHAGNNLRQRNADLKAFFERLGFTQACALCYGLIADTATPNYTSYDVLAQSAADLALATLSSKGAADLLDIFGAAPGAANPNYSSRHDGLALYILRTIKPIWAQPLFKKTGTPQQPRYETTVERKQLTSIQHSLKKLQSYLDMKIIAQVNAHTQEELSIQELYELIKLLAEAISFVVYLVDSDLAAILKRFGAEAVDFIMALNFDTLLTQGKGRLVAKDLADALLEEHLNKYSNNDAAKSVLKEFCNSFYPHPI